jgi:hypothetical protein
MPGIVRIQKQFNRQDSATISQLDSTARILPRFHSWRIDYHKNGEGILGKVKYIFILDMLQNFQIEGFEPKSSKISM